MTNSIAFNKSFIFPKLKNTSENECNFSAEEHTRKNEHEFSFLEAVKVPITRISIFLQFKNAPTRTDSYCGKSNVSKKRQCHFLQTQTMHNNFLIEFFRKNGVGSGGPTQAQSACPHFLEKNLLYIYLHQIEFHYLDTYDSLCKYCKKNIFFLKTYIFLIIQETLTWF